MGYPIYHSQYTAAQIEAAIGKGPRVNASGYWEVWNISTGAYESTSVGAGVQPPTVVTQVSQMTNHGYVYIYNGSESGYQAGYWYYWNGSAWTAGGAYQVAATDKTLAVSDAAADAKVTGDKIGELKSALMEYGVVDYIKQYGTFTSRTINKVTFTWNASNTVCSVVSDGASSNLALTNIINGNKAAYPFLENGARFRVYVNTTDTNIRVGVLFVKNSATIASTYITTKDNFTVPDDYDTALIRVEVPSGKTVNGTISVQMVNYDLLGELYDYFDAVCQGLVFNRTILTSCDLNDLTNASDLGVWIMTDANTYTHAPTGVATAFLFIFKTGTATLQIIVTYSGFGLYKRRKLGNAAWEDWQVITSGNVYNFNEYNESYTIESLSPSFTTDTNAYLAPSGDTSNRTVEIVSALTNLGVCRLGKGDYYVKNLEMPDGTQIIGSGYGTRIICIGTTDGYAIKPGDYCKVGDCHIVGALSSISLSSTVGGRHGILWQGNYTEDETPAHQPKKAILENLWIDHFTGGAITCYDTGFGTFNCIEATNIYCENCNVGINLSYWSEFHKFTNVRTPSCYYGCINNGGNNVFVNCDFSTCKLAYLMDNSQSQSPNNSHGSCIGCVFNHTDSNSGVGIKILNCPNGYIFNGCQIFYSQIQIEDSNGIVISGSNFGNTNCIITINGGGAILFANNMHQAAPTISITNNTKVHFENCYVRDTGAVVSN